jgi:hypothetical protein
MFSYNLRSHHSPAGKNNAAHVPQGRPRSKPRPGETLVNTP